MPSLPTPYYEQDGITIYHGDCREILPLIEPGSIDLVLTDPPYSDRTHNSVRSNSSKATAGNCVITFAPVTTDELRSVYTLVSRIARRWVVSTMDYATAFEFEQCPPDGLRMMRIGVWVKTNPMPQISADRPGQGWEAIAYLHKSGAAAEWNGGGRSGNYILPVEQSTGHPTAKPPLMIRDLIQRFSNDGDLILDPFMGSGTTLRAAKDLGRKAIGIELEERYCEIAAKRLQQSVLPMFAEAAS